MTTYAPYLLDLARAYLRAPEESEEEELLGEALRLAANRHGVNDADVVAFVVNNEERLPQEDRRGMSQHNTRKPRLNDISRRLDGIREEERLLRDERERLLTEAEQVHGQPIGEEAMRFVRNFVGWER